MHTITPVIHTVTVLPRVGNKWIVQGDHKREILGVFFDRQQAIASAEQVARKRHGMLVVKNADRTLDFTEDFASAE